MAWERLTNLQLSYGVLIHTHGEMSGRADYSQPVGCQTFHPPPSTVFVGWWSSREPGWPVVWWPCSTVQPATPPHTPHTQHLCLEGTAYAVRYGEGVKYDRSCLHHQPCLSLFHTVRLYGVHVLSSLHPMGKPGTFCKMWDTIITFPSHRNGCSCILTTMAGSCTAILTIDLPGEELPRPKIVHMVLRMRSKTSAAKAYRIACGSHEVPSFAIL